MLGNLKLYEWEQWISNDDMEKFAIECKCTMEVVPSIAYENEKNDGLFRAWILKKE